MTRLLQTVLGEIETTIADLRGGDRGWILLAVAVGWALSIGVRLVYPALVPFFRAEFGIDLSTTGLLLTMLWGAYAVGHVPGGFLGDRIGEGNILVVSTVIATGAVLAVATSVNLAMLFAGTIAFGLATALYGPTRFTILTDVFPERAGSAIGLTMSAGNVGNAVFPPAAAFVAGALTWRFGFGLFVPLFLAVAVAIWVAVPNRTSSRSSAVDDLSRETIERIASGMTSGAIPLVVAIQVSISFMIQGFASFYPAYLAETKGLSPGMAATLFGLFFAAGAIVQPVSGSLMDRFGTKRTLVGFLGVCVLALWLLPFTEGLLPLIAVTLLFSTWNGCGVVTQTYVADALPEDVQGTGLGTLKAGWMLLGATAPLLVGVLADAGYFNESFLLLAVVGTAGVLLSVLRL